jgi:hypothetical protein
MERLLVVVDDLDIERITVLPPEAEAPLIVDANAVLSGAIPFELLQPIAGGNAKVLEPLSRVDQAKLSQHKPLELGRKAADRFAPEQALSVPIGEALNHRG